MPRTIQPELLDALSPHHPDALHSRRDLRVINRFMGNHRWLERTVRAHIRPGERVLEVGAGTGELTHRLNRAGIVTAGLDLLPPPDQWSESFIWHSADLRTFTAYADYQVIVGNLIFHHLDDAELSELGSKIRAKARLILACEPARRRFSQYLMRAVGPIFGASHVTMHDARVSIDGGFHGPELAVALGLDSPEWVVKYSVGSLGGYRMVAHRRP